MGDLVFIRRPSKVTGDSTKLRSKYCGPLVVIEILSNNIYRVEGLRIKNGRRQATTMYMLHLKSYHIPEFNEEEEELETVKQAKEESETAEQAEKKSETVEQEKEESVRLEQVEVETLFKAMTVAEEPGQYCNIKEK